MVCSVWDGSVVLLWAYPVHSCTCKTCTCIWSSLIYTDIPFLVSFSLVMISRGLFPRLQWWGRERGGDDGGRDRGIREEGGGNVC